MNNPNAARKRILELTQANNGRITADMVVEEAKKPDSPLHDCFEWDDASAAGQFRLMQARQLIRSVRLEFNTIHTEIRQRIFVRDPDLPRDQQGYIYLPSVQSKTDQARQIVLNELRRVSQALRRAREVASVLEADEAIDEFLGHVQRIEEQVKAA